MRLSERARQFTYIREAQELGQNRGLRVEGVCRFAGADLAVLAKKDGPSWCCYAATLVLDMHFRGESKITRTGSCQEVYEWALEHHCVIDAPEIDALFLYVNAAGHAHHIGIVSGLEPLMGIAGNTSKDGRSSNGDGWYEHELLTPSEGKIVYVRVPGVEQ